MKIAFLASSVLVVAACGGKSKPAGPGPDNGAAASGPVYASLFEMGATWKFNVHTEDSGADEMGEPTTDASDDVATCSVTKVSEVEGVKVAEVGCDDHWPAAGGDSFTGFWAANASGLWHLYEWPEQDSAPQLDDAAMMFGATPTAKTEHVEDPEMEGAFTDTTVEQKGDAWCWSESGLAGDEGWTSICFDAAGPTEGSFGWAGGSVHDTKFTRAQ